MTITTATATAMTTATAVHGVAVRRVLILVHRHRQP
jgi:hypothetical protein